MELQLGVRWLLRSPIRAPASGLVFPPAPCGHTKVGGSHFDPNQTPIRVLDAHGFTDTAHATRTGRRRALAPAQIRQREAVKPYTITPRPSASGLRQEAARGAGREDKRYPATKCAHSASTTPSGNSALAGLRSPRVSLDRLICILAQLRERALDRPGEARGVLGLLNPLGVLRVCGTAGG